MFSVSSFLFFLLTIMEPDETASNSQFVICLQLEMKVPDSAEWIFFVPQVKQRWTFRLSPNHVIAHSCHNIGRLLGMTASHQEDKLGLIAVRGNLQNHKCFAFFTDQKAIKHPKVCYCGAE